MQIKTVSLLLIPLALSAFTHLWNPIGFPWPDVDEGIYLGRAINFLDTLNPIDPYDGFDHPYFGQIFLGAFLYVVGYQSIILHTSLNYETLLLLPRLLMGLLSVIDTLLIFKIAEIRYSKNTGFFASTLFAVTPITWIARWILLDSLQLPFILSSILFALLATRRDGHNIAKRNLLILTSGIFLGLSIFIKIPAFTMIPLIAYLILRENKKRVTSTLLWVMPVLVIPIIWPLHAISLDQFPEWLDVIYWQTHRESQPLVFALNDFFNIDSILLILGLISLIYVGIRKDVFLLLFAIPFLIFTYFIGYVALFHLLILVSVLSISAAKLFADILSSLGAKNRILRLLPMGVISVILIFSFMITTEYIMADKSSQYFNAAHFINQYVNSDSKSNAPSDRNNNRVTIISHPFFFWVEKYKFKNENNNFWDTDKFETDKVIFIIDRIFKNVLGENEFAYGSKFKNLFSAFETRQIASFKNNSLDDNGVIVLETDLQRYNNNTINVEKFTDEGHEWKNTRTVQFHRENRMLNLSVDNTNAAKESNINFALLNNTVDLANPPRYLHLSYYIPTYSKNPTFTVEIKAAKNNSTLWTQELKEQMGVTESEFFLLPKNILEKNLNVDIMVNSYEKGIDSLMLKDFSIYY